MDKDTNKHAELMKAVLDRMIEQGQVSGVEGMSAAQLVLTGIGPTSGALKKGDVDGTYVVTTVMQANNRRVLGNVIFTPAMVLAVMTPADEDMEGPSGLVVPS